MRRSRMLASATVAGLIVLTAGGASAAEVAVDPAAPAVGRQDLTIEITDFTPDTAVYAVPCSVPGSGDAADLSSDMCSIVDVVTATTDDTGHASLTVTWEVPAEGLGVYVGDEMRTDQATAIVRPSGAVAVVEPDTPQVEVLGTTVDESDLADTGAETTPLLFAAALLLGVGLLSVEAGRRLTPATARTR